MFEPLRGRFEVIFVGELLPGRVVVKPHSFIGDCQRRKAKGKKRAERSETRHGRLSVGDGRM
jgi:hypothetical protein